MAKIISSTPSREWKDKAAGWATWKVEAACGHTMTLRGTRDNALNYAGFCDTCEALPAVTQLRSEIETLEKTLEDLHRRIDRQNEARRRNARLGGRPRMPEARLSASARAQRLRRARLAGQTEDTQERK